MGRVCPAPQEGTSGVERGGRAQGSERDRAGHYFASGCHLRPLARSLLKRIRKQPCKLAFQVLSPWLVHVETSGAETARHARAFPVRIPQWSVARCPEVRRQLPAFDEVCSCAQLLQSEVPSPPRPPTPRHGLRRSPARCTCSASAERRASTQERRTSRLSVALVVLSLWRRPTPQGSKSRVQGARANVVRHWCLWRRPTLQGSKSTAQGARANVFTRPGPMVFCHAQGGRGLQAPKQAGLSGTRCFGCSPRCWA